tara:strand:- start:401 stop:616 length:216 start_codon:yes stop_codon:yes gene_type:complete
VITSYNRICFPVINTLSGIYNLGRLSIEVTNLKNASIEKLSLSNIKDNAYKAFVMLGAAYKNKHKGKSLKI